MGKMIKTYRVFTSPLYRVVMLFVVPFVLVALGVAMGEVIPVFGYIIIDVIADYWVFGGICSKYSAKLDYIKSSQLGNDLLKQGMRLDRVRSLLELVLIFTLIAIIRSATGCSYGFKEDVFYAAAAVLIAYSNITLAYNVGRYIEVFQLVLLPAYVAALLGILLYIGCYLLSAVLPEPVIVLLLAMLAVLVSFFTEKHMMYRIKKSYLDGGCL